MRQTAGQAWLAKRMKSPTFVAEFAKARAEVDAVDGLIRMLDEQSVELGMSRGELALRVSLDRSALRRLMKLQAMALADAVDWVLSVDLSTKRPRRDKPARNSSGASR